MKLIKYTIINLIVFVVFYFALDYLYISRNNKTRNDHKLTTSIIEPKTYDFGLIPFGQPKLTRFKLVNTGKNDLYIENIEKECKCVVFENDTLVVKPGRFINLSIGYDASMEGLFYKVISIKMNTKDEFKTLIIKGVVDHK